MLADLLGGRLRRAVLGHLSRDCNSPELAVGTVRARLDALGREQVEVLCAGQREISARLAVAECASVMRWRGEQRDERGDSRARRVRRRDENRVR